MGTSKIAQCVLLGAILMGFILSAHSSRVKRWGKDYNGGGSYDGGGFQTNDAGGGFTGGKSRPIPKTNFKCSAQSYIPGYYADVETNCQVYHVCHQGRMESQFCPPGTVFNQEILACDFENNVECFKSPNFYFKNQELDNFPLNKPLQRPESSGFLSGPQKPGFKPGKPFISKGSGFRPGKPSGPHGGPQGSGFRPGQPSGPHGGPQGSGFGPGQPSGPHGGPQGSGFRPGQPSGPHGGPQGSGFRPGQPSGPHGRPQGTGFRPGQPSGPHGGPQGSGFGPGQPSGPHGRPQGSGFGPGQPSGPHGRPQGSGFGPGQSSGLQGGPQRPSFGAGPQSGRPIGSQGNPVWMMMMGGAGD